MREHISDRPKAMLAWISNRKENKDENDVLSSTWLCNGSAPDSSLVVANIDNAGARKAADFPELAVDILKALDGGIPLESDEVKG